jgi:hypothetical protein
MGLSFLDKLRVLFGKVPHGTAHTLKEEGEVALRHLCIWCRAGEHGPEDCPVLHPPLVQVTRNVLGADGNPVFGDDGKPQLETVTVPNRPAGAPPPEPMAALRVVQRPASAQNYTPWTRGGKPIPIPRPISFIVLHTTEGSWDGACSWFADPKSQVSAHFVIRHEDGLVAQCTPTLNDIAWHAGNKDYNERSIGIEHEGYIAKPAYYTDAALHASARLVVSLCVKLNIPMDRKHIIAHSEVPPPNDHDDTGPGWPWDTYMGLVREYASSYKGPQPMLMARMFPPSPAQVAR